MDYKKKLEKFNATEKYKSEMLFMIDKMQLSQDDSVLDFGCGIETMCNAIRNMGVSCYGYDVHYYGQEKNELFITDYAKYRYTKAYFMHSLAHIPNNLEVLKVLKALVFKHIYILTPNKDWLDLQDKTNYIPDPTVIEHFTMSSLLELLIEAGFRIDYATGHGKETNGHNERIFIKASV